MRFDVRAKIRAWLLLRGVTLTEVARGAGVSSRMLRYWLAGRWRSERIEQHLAALGVPRAWLRRGQPC